MEFLVMIKLPFVFVVWKIAFVLCGVPVPFSFCQEVSLSSLKRLCTEMFASLFCSRSLGIQILCFFAEGSIIMLTRK